MHLTAQVDKAAHRDYSSRTTFISGHPHPTDLAVFLRPKFIYGRDDRPKYKTFGEYASRLITVVESRSPSTKERVIKLNYQEAVMAAHSLQDTHVQNLPVIFWQNQVVITTESLANVYKVKPIQIQQNFKNNSARFVEGIHFYKLIDQELKNFKDYLENFEVVQIAKNTKHVFLWTERGTVRHAKMLGTDKAWEVQENLEQFYFTQKAASKPIEKPEALTLADIERLIDQKLSAQKPEPPKLDQPATHIRNTTSSGVKFPEPAPGCIRCISDIDIAQLARELAVQGYRIVRQ